MKIYFKTLSIEELDLFKALAKGCNEEVIDAVFRDQKDLNHLLALEILEHNDRGCLTFTDTAQNFLSFQPDSDLQKIILAKVSYHTGDK